MCWRRSGVWVFGCGDKKEGSVHVTFLGSSGHEGLPCSKATTSLIHSFIRTISQRTTVNDISRRATLIVCR